MSLGDNVVQKSLQTNVVFTDGIHMGNGILTSLLTDSSEMVIVGLDNVPVVVIQLFDIISS